MYTMIRVTLLVICGLAIAWICDADRTVIKNEDDLIDHCTGTCGDIFTIYNVDKCTEISNCKYNSKGWVRGFVRCDYCACNCKEDLDDLDISVESKPYSVMEYDVFTTCKGDCIQAGLIRTDFKGECQELRDCKKAGTGPLCGVYRNDYCTCTCVNKRYAASYKLTDINYDTSAADVLDSAPTGLESVDLVNNDPKNPNTATATVKIRYDQTKTMEASHSLQLGLKVEVTVGIEALFADYETGVSFETTSGYEYSAGSSETSSHEYSVNAEVIVPPASTTTATISGSVMKIDVPYTATLVTTFEDGTTESKPIEGIYTDVETAKFTITYGKPVPIEGGRVEL